MVYVILMGISLLGLLADVRKKPYLLSLYLLMLLVVIFVMIIIDMFAFVVTDQGTGKGYKQAWRLLSLYSEKNK